MSQSGPLSSSGSGGPVVETLTGNSGGPVGPDAAFNIDILGNTSTGITVVGNAGTNTLTIIASAATTTQFGTIELATNAETIAGTDTTKAITADDLKAKLGTQTPHSLALFQGTSSAMTPLGVATDGQIPIGSTGVDPVLATLTAGLGISITNGPGTITIAQTGVTVFWQTISASQTLVNNQGYICIVPGGALSLLLPATSVVGDEIEVTLDGATSFTITQRAGQQIRVGNLATTAGVGGSLASTQQGDSIRLVCSIANLKWNVVSSMGNPFLS